MNLYGTGLRPFVTRPLIRGMYTRERTVYKIWNIHGDRSADREINGLQRVCGIRGGLSARSPRLEGKTNSKQYFSTQCNDSSRYSSSFLLASGAIFQSKRRLLRERCDDRYLFRVSFFFLFSFTTLLLSITIERRREGTNFKRNFRVDRSQVRIFNF